MSAVLCFPAFDLDIDYKHRAVTITAEVDYTGKADALGYVQAVPSLKERGSATVPWSALPELIRALQEVQASAESDEDRSLAPEVEPGLSWAQLQRQPR